MTTIYVAAKFHEAPRARALMERLRALGHVITYDWTVHYFEEQAGVPQDLPKCALNDMAGVAEANVLIVLHHPKLSGGMCEMGGALIMGSDVIMVGAGSERPNVFYDHELVRHVADEDAAIEALKSSPFYYDPQQVLKGEAA
jgi:hypothetical protein